MNRQLLSKNKLLNKSSAILLALLLVSYLAFQFSKPDTAIFLAKEDGIFEWLTALALFASAAFFGMSFRSTRNVFFLLLFLAMFFGAGEEISWGQRIIGYATPESVKAANVQGEFTLHNLEVFNGKQFSQHKRTGFSRLLEMDMLFKLFMFFFGIIIPLAVKYAKPIANFTGKIKFPVVPLQIGIFFLLAWLGRVAAVLLIENRTTVIKLQWSLLNGASEVYEFIAALVLFFTSYYFYKSNTATIIKRQNPVRMERKPAHRVIDTAYVHETV